MRTYRSPQLFLPALAILLFVFSGHAGDVRAQDRGYKRGKMSRHLRVDADRGGANLVDVIVTLNTQQDSDTTDFGAAFGGARRKAFRALPFQAIRVPAGALQALAANDKVKFVSPDSPVTGASVAARQTARVPGDNPAISWNGFYKGSGVTVAVIDSGMYAHPDLAGAMRAQFNFVNGAGGAPTPFSDGFGHGTHIAGMIAGDGSSSSSNKYRGVATNADIVALRVLDSEGQGNTSDVIAALDWILHTGIPNYNIRVANLSLGKGVQQEQEDDPLVQAVERVWDAGVVVVVAAGNYGNNGHFTITSPANSRKVITVGSITDKGTGTFFLDDFVSTYSSRGPTLYDHVLKPDLLAPGNRVIAPFASNGELGAELPANVICGYSSCYSSARYLQLSGTSMAASMVSGAVARMLSKDPQLNPATVKARLMKSARKISGDPTNVGAGVLDVDSALSTSGWVWGDALSPLMVRSSDGSRMYVQNTAKLWGSNTWSSSFLWSDGYLWADGYL
jgi:serine protease AprX